MVASTGAPALTRMMTRLQPAAIVYQAEITMLASKAEDRPQAMVKASSAKL